MSANRTQFAAQFEKASSTDSLPDVYRRFILDGTYIAYKSSLILGLMNRGPTYTALKWDDERMLNLEEMYDERDIKLSEVPYRPIATIPYTDEFLSIDTSDHKFPVYIWIHEDGNFYRQFETFDELLGELRTEEQMSKEIDGA